MLGGWKNGVIILTPIGKIAQKCWNEIPEHFPFVTLDEFIIMPDHVHGILLINQSKTKIGNRNCMGVQLNAHTNTPKNKNQSTNEYYSNISPKKNTLSVVIRTYKGMIKKWCNENNYPQFKWQRNYYERIIRDEDELYETRKYIESNPLQ
jgi:REP element-mobilizing transposase RayT